MSRATVTVNPGNPAYRLDGDNVTTYQAIDLVAPAYGGRNWSCTGWMLRDGCWDVTITDFTATRLQRGCIFELPPGAVAERIHITNGVFRQMYATGRGRHAAGMFTNVARSGGPNDPPVYEAEFLNCLVDRVLFDRCGNPAWGNATRMYATHNDHGWYGSKHNPDGWACRNSVFADNAYNGVTMRGGLIEGCVFIGNYVAGSIKSGGVARNNVIFVDSENGCGHNVYKSRKNPGEGLPDQLTVTDQYPLNGVRPADAASNVVLDLARRGDWPVPIDIEGWLADVRNAGPLWSEQFPTSEIVALAKGTVVPPVEPPVPPIEPPPAHDHGNIWQEISRLDGALKDLKIRVDMMGEHNVAVHIDHDKRMQKAAEALEGDR